jgi:hypothetical protein
MSVRAHETRTIPSALALVPSAVEIASSSRAKRGALGLHDATRATVIAVAHSPKTIKNRSRCIARSSYPTASNTESSRCETEGLRVGERDEPGEILNYREDLSYLGSMTALAVHASTLGVLC